jgi:hypothetical protein
MDSSSYMLVKKFVAGHACPNGATPWCMHTSVPQRNRGKPWPGQRKSVSVLLKTSFRRKEEDNMPLPAHALMKDRLELLCPTRETFAWL